MKTKAVPILFIIVIICMISIFFISRKYMLDTDKPVTRAKIVTPKTSGVSENEVEVNEKVLEGEKLDTFVPLLSTETLINTISFDFDNDSYDDEIIVVRKAGSDYLWIVPGIYNPNNKTYERLAEISTKIVKTRTFSYSGLDLIGDHRNELVFNGTDEQGNYIMQIFLCAQKKGVNELEKIGDFVSNGTIFIQQVERVAVLFVLFMVPFLMTILNSFKVKM